MNGRSFIQQKSHKKGALDREEYKQKDEENPVFLRPSCHCGDVELVCRNQMRIVNRLDQGPEEDDEGELEEVVWQD